jgi:hypothetical protein
MGNYIATQRKVVAFRYQHSSWDEAPSNFVAPEDCEEMEDSGNWTLHIQGGPDGGIDIPDGWWCIQPREENMLKHKCALSNADFVACYSTDLLP